MKIAVSASGKDLDATIDPRFGRCAYFIVVDTDDMNFEVFDNENIALGGGAGIQSAQFVASKGAGTVLTGNVGPNAVRTLSAAGVDVIVGQTGTVRQAIEAYKSGKLTSTSEPNVADHYGMQGGAALGVGRGMGMGRGGGRGMGGGMGMGRGGGRGMGGGMRAFGDAPQNPSQPPASLSKEEELRHLKTQANDLQKQIEAIESRIEESDKK
jgi:predicted Fe-Mo cluster-binding NifX family protein